MQDRDGALRLFLRLVEVVESKWEVRKMAVSCSLRLTVQCSFTHTGSLTPQAGVLKRRLGGGNETQRGKKLATGRG